MKAKIHPKYEECTVSCSCGNTFKTRSTTSEIAIVICGACHPFYTGKQKFVDTAGRIEKFKKRYQLKDNAETATVLQNRKPAPPVKPAPAAKKTAAKKASATKEKTSANEKKETKAAPASETKTAADA